MIILTISGEPISWKRPGFNKKTGGIYDQQRDEKERVRWQMRSQYKKEPLSCPVSVDIVCYFPIPLATSRAKRNQMLQGEITYMIKPDCDNLAKHLLDCMNGVLYKDDAQVWKLTVTKLYSDDPRTTLTIAPRWKKDMDIVCDGIDLP